MSISKNVATYIKRYRQEQAKTWVELSDEWGISLTALKQYAHGTANPRVDTIELLAKKMGVAAEDLVADQPAGWQTAMLVLRAARELAGLPEPQRNEAIRLFLELVELFEEVKV